MSLPSTLGQGARVLHDLNLAARYGDRLVLLQRGKVAAAGTVDEVVDPATIERVYGVSVRRVIDEDAVELIFRHA